MNEFDMPLENEIRQTAKKSARHLQIYGWLQGTYGNLEKPCCLYGVIGLVGDVNQEANLPIVIETRNRVRRLLDVPCLIAWNDHPDRTDRDVIGILVRVANGEK